MVCPSTTGVGCGSTFVPLTFTSTLSALKVRPFSKVSVKVRVYLVNFVTEPGSVAFSWKGTASPMS